MVVITGCYSFHSQGRLGLAMFWRGVLIHLVFLKDDFLKNTACENASEGDPAVTDRVMDFHETELFSAVCYLAHIRYTQLSH